jgi:hypothetical protein
MAVNASNFQVSPGPDSGFSGFIEIFNFSAENENLPANRLEDAKPNNR